MRWQVAMQLLLETATSFHVSIFSATEAKGSGAPSENAVSICAQWPRCSTSGLVDLFGHAQLVSEIKSWARQNHRLQDAVSATHYLVLAIGYQSSEEDLASSYFEYARNIALANLSGNINVPTIQTFILGSPVEEPAELDDKGQEIFDLLNASAQIFLITEGIVVEVYSRRKVSYQLTEAVILVSRPFLMYELYKRLADGVAETPTTTSGLTSGKSKLADACIDAASFMVDILVGLVEKGVLIGHMPLVVSWLFASSLILGVGLLGSFGRILEKYTRNSILVLEHFAKIDAHASQYSLIAKSLLNAALEYLEKKELRERMQRTESSSQLFGLVPRESTESIHNIQASATEASPNTSTDGSLLSKTNNSASGFFGLGSPSFVDVDASLLSLSSSLPRTPDLSMLDGRNEMDHGFGDLNLFQLLDGDGHIDLGPYI
ncbi:fungal specific transcription factor domain-containing protein [Colletotrichum tamarilloi]|uniref:Fungal specific transcription factor domain-containing protein n=1 Tax=Colletotrichum tamarilloi TaxID=1209934 RepID=A0ABQ9QP85_9PEZI|nr:fungal specific transcription factor domain-containing protein [Colletotrichum tamarilloi]KAK1480259.1 fungal specific transcription factor domain-containing protein [Colletotrichum tamarilloi]